MMSPTLTHSILAAIAWADGFDLAITPFELWQQLPIKASLTEVIDTLKDKALASKLHQQDGLVMLDGRDGLVAERRQRIAVAWLKYKKLRRLARVLAYLPFIRLVAVCNTLALAHGKPAADLDLFIVTQSRRLWSGRLLCVMAAKLLGGRPSTRTSKNKYCLSFYVSEDDLNIERFVEAGHDYYLTAWTSWVLPLYDAGGYVTQFADANKWVSASLPQTRWGLVAPRWRATRAGQTKMLVENAWPDALEKFLEQIQRAYLPQALKNAAAKNTTSVVLNDTSLKFHLDDKRGRINQGFEEKLSMV